MRTVSALTMRFESLLSLTKWNSPVPRLRMMPIRQATMSSLIMNPRGAAVVMTVSSFERARSIA